MYSFQEKGEQKDKMKNNDRYIGAGLTFKQDALAVVGVVEGQIRAKGDKNDHYKNGFTYNLGANYDFGMAKVFAGAQYAHNTNFSDIQHGFAIDKVTEKLAENDAFLKEVLKDINDDAGKLKADYPAATTTPEDQAKAKIVEAKAKAMVDNLNALIAEGKVKDAKKVAFNASTNAKLQLADGGDAKEANIAPMIVGIGNIANKQQFNGYALTLGSQIPFGANKVTVAGYMGQYKNAHDYIVNKKDVKLDIYGLDARYEYSLSKRTTLAAGAGIGQSQIKYDGDKVKSKIAQVYAGLHHNF